MVIWTRVLNNMSKVSGLISMSVKDIVTGLERFAPTSLAESWDNVGLLVDPMRTSNMQNLMLTNDLTEDVVEEAKTYNAGMIISYHPNIFRPIKSVTDRTWKERVIVECIKNNIAVYSPHTSWDAVKGGVNDWLGSALPFETSVPIQPNANDPNAGVGRVLTLNIPMPVGDIVLKVKAHIGIPYLRLALARDKNQYALVKTVALCAGSGASVLAGVQADLYLTGEMLHHDILDATQKGIHVILCNHSDSERGFLKTFQKKLQDEILEGRIQVVISEKDHDPLITV